MKLPKKIDHLIVGAGVVGLSLLKKLTAENKSVILIEKSADSSGSLLLEDLTFNSIAWTKEKHSHLFSYNEELKETLTFGKKGMIPFMGFGEEKVAHLDVVDSFTSSESFIATGFKIENFEELEAKIFHHTQITNISKTEDSEHDNFFEINGKTFLQAENVIWTAPIQELETILPKEEFQTMRQKIKKAEHLDGLTATFQIAKEELGEMANNKFVFLGEENTPWFGAATQDNLLVFTSFFTQALSGDHDFIRKHLKNLKKKLTKAFPEAFPEETQKSFTNEKICTHKAVLSGIKLSFDKNGNLKELPNFTFLGSHKGFWPYTLDGKLNALSQSPTPTPELETQADL